ncbi:GNAT family N-acetyltransferase [Clostridium sp. CS001]|uniref:GNAT family N-acetyltransferase n=1 Tax=Clostridium sp. CS001 TaxID=2880648 RepID=UPI001CF238B8|nr:GNAT family N-acetyltransferase [Clostridium sp. CS001]MCB2288274.1 GNAT family N-acetyltransferase [Clostridium sp. CS001]
MNWEVKKFNELTGQEVYEILKLRNEVFVVEQQCIYQDCDDKDKKAYHLFGEENGEIVAYLRILKKNISYNEISIGRVLTNKTHRGRGLGKEMMLNAMEFIEKHLGEKTIRISAQQYLFKFYSNLGFVKVSEEYLEDEIPHIEMLYKKL